MATYHLSIHTIGRSAGRSATAAAAYRAGEALTDARTGEVHDYTRKAGVLHAEIVLPGGGTIERSTLWNAVELHHKRGDAVLAREVEVSLPTELSPAQRQTLAVDFARELAKRYSVAVDVVLHAPRSVSDHALQKNPRQHVETDPTTGRRHNGNWHAHILLSACHVSATGDLGKKAVALDPIHCQRAKIANLADSQRARWAQRVNAALEHAGQPQRVDHRRLEAQGIEREPTQHLGPAAAGFERRTGEPSAVRLRYEREASERLASAKEAGDLERQRHALDRSILDLSGDLRAALAERDRRPTVKTMQTGLARIREKFAAHQLVKQHAAAALAERERQEVTKRDTERAVQQQRERDAAAEKIRQEQLEAAAAQRKRGNDYSR